MFDSFLLTVNQWISGNFAFAVLGSFLWGLVSVLFSPCHIASIPLMVGYMMGQNDIKNRSATVYALLFSSGLFISITIVGVICAFMGKMLGNISPYWGIPIGILIAVLGVDLMGYSVCRIPGRQFAGSRIKGYQGSFLLGLSYGILSGACTFGFLAPILAMITVQERIITGILLLVAFAIGHCTPIAIAGGSVKLAQKMLESKLMRHGAVWGRRIAGGLVTLVGVYLIIRSFGVVQ